jgi:hypothetical protein
MRSKKYCKSYVGVACVNGSCPNALRNEDIEAYKEVRKMLNKKITLTLLTASSGTACSESNRALTNE